MVRCYLCQDIGSNSLEPCPNDPPCKPQDICGFQVTRCEHKEEARIKALAEEQWRQEADAIGTSILDWYDWEELPEENRLNILATVSTEDAYKRGFVAGYQERDGERR